MEVQFLPPRRRGLLEEVKNEEQNQDVTWIPVYRHWLCGEKPDNDVSTIPPNHSLCRKTLIGERPGTETDVKAIRQAAEWNRTYRWPYRRLQPGIIPPNQCADWSTYTACRAWLDGEPLPDRIVIAPEKVGEEQAAYNEALIQECIS